jgi:hypothetical protein
MSKDHFYALVAYVMGLDFLAIYILVRLADHPGYKRCQELRQQLARVVSPKRLKLVLLTLAILQFTVGYLKWN